MSAEFDTRPVFTTRRKEQEWIRMQAVKIYRKGMSAADIAAIFEITPRAVLQWVATFINCGQNGLVAKKVSGRPPKLNAEQLRRMAFLVREHCPNQLSFDFGLWTLRLIAQLIEREFKVKLSIPTVGKVMHALGFSPQRPLHRAWEQNAVLVSNWRAQVLPELVARAKRNGARVLFADEAGVRSDYHCGTTWGPMGKTPIVRSTVSTQGRLEHVYLPLYSTQLNPDKQVWEHVKADIAKRPIANKFDFRLAVVKALSRLKSKTETIAAFFRHPECGFI